MTIGELLSDVHYDKKGILQKLICHYCSLSREQMRVQIDHHFVDSELQSILEGYKQYVDYKKPLEYILGQVTFLGIDFQVTPDTLIPRPETEYMIQAVNEHIQLQEASSKLQENILLDVGTGCGVLGLSVLIHNPGFFTQAILSDYSEKALEVAKGNYASLVASHAYRQAGSKLQVPSTHVVFVQGSLLDHVLQGENGEKDIKNWIATPSARNDDCDLRDQNVVLVANLPYIPDETFDTSVDDTVKNREPRMAFVGGNDGLDLYRRMFDQIKSSALRAPPLSRRENLVMFLEMMTWQIDILRQEYGNSFVFEEVKTFHFNIRILKVTCFNASGGSLLPSPQK